VRHSRCKTTNSQANSKVICHKIFATLLFASCWLSASKAAQFEESLAMMEDDMELLFGDEEFVSIATGSAQPLSRAPAVASVITAADIRAIGAVELDEVLETVPGLHVSRSPGSYAPIYIMRGIYSKFNPQVLFLINGTPITNLFGGDRNQIWAGMPVNNIARIEVIRGPGSAIYGADAYSGVINIITKKSSEIDGTELGARLGSFNSKEAWVLHGAHYKGFDVALSMQSYSSDGQREKINQDAALRAGSVNTGLKRVDSRLDVIKGAWQLRLGYQGRRDVESGAGIAEALDPTSRYKSDRINADITYHNPQLSDTWELTTQLSYFDTTQEAQSDLVLLPTGVYGPPPNGSFADGVIGAPEVFERHYRIGVSAFYKGIDAHKIRIGSGAYIGDLYRVKERKNFTFVDPNNPALGLANIGTVQNITGSERFLPTKTREVFYAYVQDEWSAAADWTLTGGVRFDDYSDFGSTINPRAAVVWDTDYDLTTKLLYGKAFRAPSMGELYAANNPANLGNRNLDPETIETVELAFTYRPSPVFQSGLNLYHFIMKDIIRPIALGTQTKAQNSGKQLGMGVEYEFTWEVGPRFGLKGSYAYQQNEDRSTNDDAGHAPSHQLYLRGDWHLNKTWHFNTQINRIAARKRVAGDPRSEVNNYTTVDLTLRRETPNNQESGWGVAIAVKNLFDDKVLEPSQYAAPPAPNPTPIPGDLPLAGRQFVGELSYSFY